MIAGGCGHPKLVKQLEKGSVEPLGDGQREPKCCCLVCFHFSFLVLQHLGRASGGNQISSNRVDSFYPLG